MALIYELPIRKSFVRLNLEYIAGRDFVIEKKEHICYLKEIVKYTTCKVKTLETLCVT